MKSKLEFCMFNRKKFALSASRILLCAMFVVTLRGAPVFSQESEQKPAPDEVRTRYTKYEFRIPMRDGAHLFTAVYVPKDAAAGKTYPFLIQRTPYSSGPFGADNYRKHLGPAAVFEKDGFIFVYQDVRGRFMSEGTFIEMTPHKDVKKSAKDVDESTDAYDTIDWLVKNVAGNNGKAGLYGISYPGFFVSASMIDSHPALKACSPQAPVTDLYMGDDAYHNGAFMLAANFDFYTFFKPHLQPQLPRARPPFDFGTNDGYEFFLEMGPLSNAKAKYMTEPKSYWDDQANHTTYDDYWKSHNIATHLKNVKCAVMTVGGLFDAEDIMGPYRVFRAVGEANPGTPNVLVEGPWFHGGWAAPGGGDHLGPVNFAAKNSDYFNEGVLLPFFREYLKDSGDAKLSKITIFETGTNVWRRYDSWPPKNVEEKKLYLSAKGRLSFEVPKDSGFDEYVSDPARPVPFIESFDNEVPREYMTADQRFAAKRPDVLVYETEPLEEDVTVAGEVSPRLWVSSSGTDSDFDVKLIDVYPVNFPDPQPNPKELHMGGYEQLVRGEPFRAKYRNSFEKPEALTPNQPTALNFSLPSVNHTFRRGHRIMVQVQSTWFPLTDRNPQKFVDISKATEADFQKATERVYRGGAQASSLVLPVLK